MACTSWWFTAESEIQAAKSEDSVTKEKTPWALGQQQSFKNFLRATKSKVTEPLFFNLPLWIVWLKILYTANTFTAVVNWSEKAKSSYILVVLHALFAVLDVSSAVDVLLSGFRCVFVVCNLSAEEAAGLRWLREGIGRVDLPGESLIQRSHDPGPVLAGWLKACRGRFDWFLWGSSVVFPLCAKRRRNDRQFSPPERRQKD